MIRKSPVRKAVSAPATGRFLYAHLMKNIAIPASASHKIWYAGEKAKLDKPEDYAFRGGTPTHEKHELVTLSGNPIVESETSKKTDIGTFIYRFKGDEGPILVSDLSDRAKEILKIPTTARDKDKVFNPNFVKYKDLDEMTRYSNELAALSFSKSISGYFGAKGKINYSEKDVLGFLDSCFEDLSREEMMHVLNSNHLAWSALAYVRETGDVKGDLMAEFHSQNPTDFYIKDLGTVLPAMFFALANLGQNPVEYHDKLDIEVWGARDAAEFMRKFMHD